MDADAVGDAEAAATGPRTFVLGLTGSIGMGKSTVSAMFREESVPVWDADATVHELYGPGGAAVPLVGAAFPGVVKDGAIDRAALSAQVVGNEAAMKRLESIVHPLVAQSRLAFLERVRRAGAPLAVLDIPLLFETSSGPSSGEGGRTESGQTAGGREAGGGGGGGAGAPRGRHGTDAVAVVSATADAQRARVLARQGMSEEKLAAIVGRQVPDAEKRRLADYVIDTSTDLATTRAAVAELVRRLSSDGR